MGDENAERSVISLFKTGTGSDSSLGSITRADVLHIVEQLYKDVSGPQEPSQGVDTAGPPAESYNDTELLSRIETLAGLIVTQEKEMIAVQDDILELQHLTDALKGFVPTLQHQIDDLKTAD